mgnify:CR=1 FL=1
MQLGQPSIDQLRIFLAVIDEGSFGGAAKRLGRAISAISYGIAQLEALLAMRLFAREGSRRPELTPAGRALLPAARAVAGDMDALLAQLYALITVPEYQARLRWQPNTLAVWDNRSTQHYVVGDYFPQHRKLHRITFTADQAF